MFSRIGAAAYKKDLANIRILSEYLGDPDRKFKSIHIAGTNGKGSTSHMLAAILQTAGYKTGLYTSPHLKDFRERIRVNGAMIEKDFVVEFTSAAQPLIQTLDPSFFEITVAMAFDYFAKKQVEIAVIEVGLGGRLDSTNIILPELCVITNIGWDHMNMLGDTLEKIALEKAGIIKQGVPVVIGETLPVTKSVFQEVATEKKSPIHFADQTRYVDESGMEKDELVVEVVNSQSNEKQVYRLDLPGIYQTRNLVTVLETVYQLREMGWHLPEKKVQTALRQVKKLTGLHGRWQIVHHHPLLVFDVAHNVDGMKQVTEQLEITDHKELHIVIGMVKDKEVEKILELLPKAARYYFTRAQIPRALPEDQLAKAGSALGLHGNHFPDVNDALRSAFANAGKEDLILVCGSVFLIGEIEWEEGGH